MMRSHYGSCTLCGVRVLALILELVLGPELCVETPFGTQPDLTTQQKRYVMGPELC